MITTVLYVSSINCAACVAKIEKAMMAQGCEVMVNLATKRVTVTHDPARLDTAAIIKTLESIGHTPVVEGAGDEKSTAQSEIRGRARQVLLASLFSLPLVVLAMGPMWGIVFSDAILARMGVLQWLLATPVLWIGRSFFIKGIGDLRKTKTATMDTLVALGVGAAYLYSLAATLGLMPMAHVGTHLYYETSAFLITFILLGRFLEAMARGKTASAIRALMNLQPTIARVSRQGVFLEIAVADVLVGDVLSVKPGEQIPVDGCVLTGQTAVDESMITGESMPVDKFPGTFLIGGTLNKFGAVTYRATKVGSDTFLAQVIRMVEAAQNSKAPVQKLADRIAAFFVPVVLVIALLSFVTWLALGYSLVFAVGIFITVMVIACPCALGLATPTAVMVGTGLAAKAGVLIKNAETLQKTAEVTALVFDKTGTLTLGKPSVTHLLPANGVTDVQLLQCAASLNQHSEHPLGQAIVAMAKSKNINFEPVTNFAAKAGLGVVGVVGGRHCVIGNPALIATVHANFDPESLAVQALESEGKTVVFVASGADFLGAIALADTLKPDAKLAIMQMHQQGMNVYMLTGDNARTAAAIAADCGITEVMSRMLPQDKLGAIRRLQSEGHVVAMVGDGINDAPALALADVGMAMGAGTDVAMASADIVLIQNKVQDVLVAVAISKYSMRKIKQNLFWAFAYNVLGLPIAAGILYLPFGFLLNPMIAGTAMAFSSVSVIGNTLGMSVFWRLFRHRFAQ